MTAAHVGEKVCHPVVIIKVNGVKAVRYVTLGPLDRTYQPSW